jgi:hypothetical protein
LPFVRLSKKEWRWTPTLVPQRRGQITVEIPGGSRPARQRQRIALAIFERGNGPALLGIPAAQET